MFKYKKSESTNGLSHSSVTLDKRLLLSLSNVQINKNRENGIYYEMHCMHLLNKNLYTVCTLVKNNLSRQNGEYFHLGMFDFHEMKFLRKLRY